MVDRYRRMTEWAIKYRRRYRSNKKLKVKAMMDRHQFKLDLDHYKAALEKIRDSDRKISGMGSTSGENKSWWVYGQFGNIAKEALTPGEER